MSPDYNTTKYVWTDFGGVLTPPVSHTMRVFCQKYGLTESQLRAGFEAVARNHNPTDPLELVDGADHVISGEGANDRIGFAAVQDSAG